MQELGLDKTMQVSFDFTEQTEIVKREKRKYLEARQDWKRAPKIIVTEEYIGIEIGLNVAIHTEDSSPQRQVVLFLLSMLPIS